METNQRVARAAALVMVAFAASRLLGLVRQMVFAMYFGTGPAMDAYEAALRIPDTIFMVVAGGALGSAFIPLFTARLTAGRPRDAWRLASALSNLLLVILLPISLLCILLAPWLVRAVVAPALPPAVQAQTATLMRVMLLSTFIFGVSGVVMGTLNAHQHFLLPAVAPIVYNLALIAGAVWGGRSAVGVLGPAIGMVVGALGHLLVQVPGLLRHDARYVPTLGLGDPGVRQVGLLMAPRMLGMAAAQINSIVSNNLASYLGLGAIAALGFAWRLMLLPQGVFAQAVGTAVFPTFSAQAARGELAGLRETLSLTLRVLIAITLPATVGLILLGEPVVALFFERGEFDAVSTRNVAWAVSCYALGLVGFSALEVLGRAFYALHDTWTPALAAGGAVVLSVVLGLALPPLFLRWGGVAHAGLALATALSALVNMGVLLALIHRRVGDFDVRGLGLTTLRVAAASAGMGAALLLWRKAGPQGAALQTALGIPLGAGVYVGLAFALGVAELRQSWQMIAGRGRAS